MKEKLKEQIIRLLEAYKDKLKTDRRWHSEIEADPIVEAEDKEIEEVREVLNKLVEED